MPSSPAESEGGLPSRFAEGKGGSNALLLWHGAHYRVEYEFLRMGDWKSLYGNGINEGNEARKPEGGKWRWDGVAKGLPCSMPREIKSPFFGYALQPGKFSRAVPTKTAKVFSKESKERSVEFEMCCAVASKDCGRDALGYASIESGGPRWYLAASRTIKKFVC